MRSKEEPKAPPSSSNPDERKPDKPSVPRLLPEKLTPSEIEALRQDAKEGIAFARKAFEKKP